MAKITALKLQKRNRNRVNVYLAGEFAFGLERIVAGWLNVGDELSPEKIIKLRADDQLEAAYQHALHFLSYRERSSDEVKRYLYDRGLEAEIIESVLARLERSRLVNDQRFANAWVENRNEFRPRSRRALAYELAQKGVPQTQIEAALDNVADEELAYEAAHKQARRYEHLEWQDFRRKMFGHLARRGFNYEVSAPAVQQVWAELHSTPPNTDIQEI